MTDPPIWAKHNYRVKTLLQLDRTTVYRMLRTGEIAAVRCGRQWRVAPETLSEFLRGERRSEETKQVA